MPSIHPPGTSLVPLQRAPRRDSSPLGDFSAGSPGNRSGSLTPETPRPRHAHDTLGRRKRRHLRGERPLGADRKRRFLSLIWPQRKRRPTSTASFYEIRRRTTDLVSVTACCEYFFYRSINTVECFTIHGFNLTKSKTLNRSAARRGLYIANSLPRRPQALI